MTKFKKNVGVFGGKNPVFPKKNNFFSNFRGAGLRPPPSWTRPWLFVMLLKHDWSIAIF
jgi:hypothetical protein